jgi:L-cystine uptake protein TcyP (sodium:dicarboxylate symporter family)
MVLAAGAGVVFVGVAGVTGAGTADSIAASTVDLSIWTAASLVARASPLKDCGDKQCRRTKLNII